MKKILIMIFLTVITPVLANPSVLPSRQVGSITKQAPDRPNPLVRTQQSNMILNVQQGIGADQKGLNSRYFNNGPGIKQQPNVRYNHKYPPHPGMNPNAYSPVYAPRTYRFNYDDSRGTQTVVGKAVSRELSVREKERGELEKRYSTILKNRTLDGNKKCARMMNKMQSQSYEEQNRVLNEVLGLNCSIR